MMVGVCVGFPWREVSNDMFKLWYLAEGDLLREGSYYTLTNTGQGLNRVQNAPSTNKAIHQVLVRCQSKLGHWVGSSVVGLYKLNPVYP